ncbi:MAG: hypothetical protein IKD73_02980 [Selenomonadaceae bacterium]|nr:hypothetical protein [Selenomonadaceae bacterium]
MFVWTTTGRYVNLLQAEYLCTRIGVDAKGDSRHHLIAGFDDDEYVLDSFETHAEAQNALEDLVAALNGDSDDES